MTFTFESMSAVYTTIIMYIFLAIAWFALWMTVRRDKKMKDVRFIDWWLGKANPSGVSCFLNWTVFLLFIVNLVRLALTLIFGFNSI